jgi:sugar lactone lactonase YvrE
MNNTKKWNQNGLTIAGANKQDNQLNKPRGIYVDNDHQYIYIADYGNDRIVEWAYHVKTGQIVAGRNFTGNQLNQPTDVILDKKTDSLIICDYGNRRVVRWSRRNGTNGETIISNIDCFGLTMDNNGDLYVSDTVKNEVRKWKIGEKTNGTIVAGGNETGNNSNQLHYPTYLFVDKAYSVYVSDHSNHRVVKSTKDPKEGIVVAGGQDQGNSLRQLSHPTGVIVDEFDNIYVADSYNHRIMCWPKGSEEGRIIVGENGNGKKPNQFSYPTGLSFDRQGNLYVPDNGNNRVQKFEIDLN